MARETKAAMAANERAAAATREAGGLRAQLEWCRRTTSDFLRRGFCDACYERDPPAKRLRVGGSQECAQCVFSRCLQ